MMAKSGFGFSLGAQPPEVQALLGPQAKIGGNDRLAMVLAALADGADTLQGRASGGMLASTQAAVEKRRQQAQEAALFGGLLPGSGLPSPVNAGAGAAAPVDAPAPAPAPAPDQPAPGRVMAPLKFPQPNLANLPQAGAPAASPAASPAAPFRIDLTDPASVKRIMALSYMNPTLGAAMVTLANAQQPKVMIGPDGTPYDQGDANVLSHGPFADYEFQGGRYRNKNNPTEANAAPFVDQKEGNATIWMDGPNGPGTVPVIAAVPGAAEAAARQAGLIAGAQAKGTAPYEFVTVPDAQGRPRVSAKSAVAGGDFTGPTPDAQAFATSRGTAQASALTDAEAAERSVANQADILTQAQKALTSGDVITGLGAPVRLQAARAMAAIGDPKAIRQVAATQTFQSTMNARVMTAIKALGSGSGLTDADREFTKKVVGGDISLDATTIQRLVDIQRRQIEAIHSNAETLRRSAPSAATNGGVGGVRAPRAAPQPGAVEGGYRFNGGDPANPSSWSKQ